MIAALLVHIMLLATVALAAPTENALFGRSKSSGTIPALAKRHLKNVTNSGGWFSGPTGDMYSIATRFTVPSVYGLSDANSGAIVMGIDAPWDHHFSSGIMYNITGGETSYTVFYSSSADFLELVEGFPVGAGDSIYMNITADSTTTGTFMIDNENNGWSVTKDLTASEPLSLSFLEWGLEYDVVDGNPMPPLPFELTMHVGASAHVQDGQTHYSRGTFTVEGISSVAFQDDGNTLAIGPASS